MLTRRSVVRMGAAFVGACAGMLLAGCSNAADETACRTAADEALSALIANPSQESAIMLLGEKTVSELDEWGVSCAEYLSHCLARASYEIEDVSVDGDTGTVTVSVTNADVPAAMQQAGERFDSYLASDEAQTEYDDGGEQALMEVLFSYLYEAVDAADEKTSEVAVPCTKDGDGTWTCNLAASEGLVQALVGTGVPSDVESAGEDGSASA